MHKKLLILYAITNTMCYINITAESDAQKAWTAYKKHTQDQQQQDPFYQLKEAAYDVALDSKQQQLLAACLYRNCNACFKLKNEIQEKLKKDTTTLRDAADNSKKLEIILQDATLTNGEKIAFAKAIEKEAEDYYSVLQETMPATYRLFKYECANNSTNTSDTNTQTFYVLVIKNHTYEKAFVFENSEILQEDVTNCLLEKRDLGQITLALFKCERNNCKNLISRQSVAMPVHSVDLINHDATTDLHRELVYICANTGAFATLLEEIHTAHVEHLLDCLQAVIAKQCGHGC